MDTKRSLSGAPTSPRKWTQKRVKTDSLLEDSRLFRPTSPLKWHRKKTALRPKISAPLEVANTKFYTPTASSRTEAGGFAYNVELPHSFTFNHSSIFHEHLSDSDKSREEKEQAFNYSVDSFSKSMEMLKQTATSPANSAGRSTASSSRLNLSMRPLAPLALSSVPPLDIPHELMQHNHENPSDDEFHDTRTSFRHSFVSLHGLTDINNEINDINAQIQDINQQIRGIGEVDKMESVSAVAPVEQMVTAKMEIPNSSSPDHVDTENILAELSSLEHEEEEEEDEEEMVEEERISEGAEAAAEEEDDSLRPLEYDLGSGPKSSMPRFPTSSTLGTLVDDNLDKHKTGGVTTAAANVASPRSFATSASARTLFADRFTDPESIRDSIRVVDISVRDDDEEEEELHEEGQGEGQHQPEERQQEMSHDDSSSALNSSSVIASTPIELSHANLPTNLFRTHQDRSKYTETGILDNRVSLISTGDKYPLDIDNLSPVRGGDEPSFSLRGVPIETSHRDDYIFEQMKAEQEGEEEEGERGLEPAVSSTSRPISSVSTHSSSLAGTAGSTDSLGIHFAPPDLLSQPMGFKMVSNDMGGCSSSDDSALHHANDATERAIPLPNFGNSSFAELNSGDYQFPDIEVDEPQMSQTAPETPLSVHSQQFSYPPSLSYSPASMDEPIMHPPRAHVPFVFRSRELDEKDHGLYAQNNTVFVNNAFIPFYPSPENSPQFPFINSFPDVRGVANKEPPKEYLEVKAQRDKEIARLTREFEQRDKELLAEAQAGGKDTTPDVFNIPATPAPLRVRKQRKDRPMSDRPVSEVPQIPKRAASRRSSKRSSLIPSSETHHSDIDAIQPLPMIDASRIEPDFEKHELDEKRAEVLSPTTSQQRQASAGSTGTVIRHPLQNQFPSLPDNQMLFMTRTGQKQNFGKIHSVKSNPGGTHLYDLEAQRENNMCRDSISLLMLFLFFFMPPLWLAMGLGYLDSVAGEVKRSHKKAALVLGGTMMVAAVVGISVGLGVGLTR